MEPAWSRAGRKAPRGDYTIVSESVGEGAAGINRAGGEPPGTAETLWLHWSVMSGLWPQGQASRKDRGINRIQSRKTRRAIPQGMPPVPTVTGWYKVASAQSPAPKRLFPNPKAGQGQGAKEAKEGTGNQSTNA